MCYNPTQIKFVYEFEHVKSNLASLFLLKADILEFKQIQQENIYFLGSATPPFCLLHKYICIK